MKHYDFNYIMKYFDGEVSEEQKKAIEDHLRVCDYCRSELAQLKKLSFTIRSDIESIMTSIEGEDIIPESVKSEIIRESIGGIRKEATFSHKLIHLITELFYFKPRQVIVFALSFLIVATVSVVLLLILLLGRGEGSIDYYSGSIASSSKIGVKVLQLQFINSTGSLFQIEDKEGDITTVIWIDEFGGEKQ